MHIFIIVLCVAICVFTFDVIRHIKYHRSMKKRIKNKSTFKYIYIDSFNSECHSIQRRMHTEITSIKKRIQQRRNAIEQYYSVPIKRNHNRH